MDYQVTADLKGSISARGMKVLRNSFFRFIVCIRLFSALSDNGDLLLLAEGNGV